MATQTNTKIRFHKDDKDALQAEAKALKDKDSTLKNKDIAETVHKKWAKKMRTTEGKAYSGFTIDKCTSLVNQALSGTSTKAKKAKLPKEFKIPSNLTPQEQVKYLQEQQGKFYLASYVQHFREHEKKTHEIKVQMGFASDIELLEAITRYEQQEAENNVSKSE